MLGQFIPQPIVIPIPPLRATLVAAANVLGRTGLNSKEMFDTMTLENIRRRLEEAISGDLPDVQAISALFLEDGVIGTIAASGDPALIGNAALAAALLVRSRTGPDVREALLSIDAMQTVAREGNSRQIQHLVLASEGLPESRWPEVRTHLFTRRALETLRLSRDVQALATAAISFTHQPREDFERLMRSLLTDDNLNLLATSGEGVSIGLVSVACQFLPAAAASRSLKILLTRDAVGAVANQTQRTDVIGWVARGASVHLAAADARTALGPLLTPDALRRVAASQDGVAISWVAAAARHLPDAGRAVALDRLLDRDALTTLVSTDHPVGVSRVAEAAAASGHAQVLGRTALAMSALARPDQRDAMLRLLLTEQNLGSLAASKDASAIGWAALAVSRMTEAQRRGAFDQLLTEEALSAVVENANPVQVSRVARAVADQGHPSVIGRTAMSFSRLPDHAQRETALSGLLTPKVMRAMRDTGDEQSIRDVLRAADTVPAVRRAVLTGPLLDDMPLWRKGFFNLIPGRAPSATASPAARAKTPTGPGLG